MRGWKISKNVKHDMAPAWFAYEFAKAQAKAWGLPWKCSAIVTSLAQWDRGYGGRAWPWRKKILVRLAPKLNPHVHIYPKFADMPAKYLAGGAESIVYIFAHEFRHILGGGSGKAAEIAACNFGYAAVEAWREQQYNCPTCLI